VVGDGFGVVGVGGVPGDTVLRTVLRATARGFGFCGLATCFGAWIVMLGREVAPGGVSVCDIAVPLRPHSSSAIDRIATARLEMKRDENLIAVSFQMRGQPIPSHPGTLRRRSRSELSPLHSILIAV
jgi:hypothetical protein